MGLARRGRTAGCWACSTRPARTAATTPSERPGGVALPAAAARARAACPARRPGRAPSTVPLGCGVACADRAAYMRHACRLRGRVCRRGGPPVGCNRQRTRCMRCGPGWTGAAGRDAADRYETRRNTWSGCSTKGRRRSLRLRLPGAQSWGALARLSAFKWECAGVCAPVRDMAACEDSSLWRTRGSPCLCPIWQAWGVACTGRLPASPCAVCRAPYTGTQCARPEHSACHLCHERAYPRALVCSAFQAAPVCATLHPMWRRRNWAEYQSGCHRVRVGCRRIRITPL
jgi:hypothetical protein